MEENYCFILKRKTVEFEGKEIDTFEYIVSCCYGKEERNKNQVFWEDMYVDNIENYETKDNEYYFYAKGYNDYNIDILAKYDEDYSGKYFTVQVINGKIKLDIVINKKLIDAIEGRSNPAKVYSSVLEVVKGQDEHVKSILSSIYWNQRLYDTELSLYDIAKTKHNLLVMGPTGVGKTEIIRQIASNLNMPITVVDATTYTETGYIGNSVDHMLCKILMNVDENINLAQRSILVIDEFDKLAKSQSATHAGINKEGVQRSLLTLIEGATRDVRVDNRTYEFDTHGLTIICLGAFSNLEYSKQNNLIGFNIEKGFRTNSSKNFETKSTRDKVVEYGFEPEIVGRLNKVVVLNKLSKENLLEILKSPKGSLGIKLNTLRKMGIDVELDYSYLEEIANLAFLDGKGARSLNYIIDEIFDEELSNAMISGASKIRIKKKEFKNN